MAKTTELGKDQRGMLELLLERGFMNGWVWGTRSRSIRIAESLVKHGYAVKTEENKFSNHVDFKITEAGKAVALAGSLSLRIKYTGKI